MRLQRLILIRNGAVALDLILDLVDLVLLYEKRICLYMWNILFLKYKLIRFSCDLNFLVCYSYVLALSAIVMHYRRACEH